MKCPACDTQLTEETLGDVVVDVCKLGCGGIWFDNWELDKLDEPHEHLGEPLLDVEIVPGMEVDHSEKRECPKCDGITMMRHFFSVKREIEVDECPACAGIWLDVGELKRIRNQYDTEEERKQAAKEYFDEVFSEKLARMKGESQESLDKAQRIANIFRFICPSYYIPGKQDWGAF
jgi:Zn-finger nucleic acid-binding protein